MNIPPVRSVLDMRFAVAVLAVMLFASIALSQATKRYSWQNKNFPCNETQTFCWYGSELSSDPEVIAYGNRWVSKDKEEKPFEWITEVRCVQKLRVCILAHNLKLIGGGSQTQIDLYHVEEWSGVQVRAVGEPAIGNCEIDSLLLNRAEGSVSMLTVPGPDAGSALCLKLMKPKTVVYQLQIGLSPMDQRD
jgi:hypothetical protein